MVPPRIWLLWLFLACAALARPTSPVPGRQTYPGLLLDGVAAPAPELPVWAHYAEARPSSLVDWDPRGQGLLVLTSFGACDQLAQIPNPLCPPVPLTELREQVVEAEVRPGSLGPGVLLQTDPVGNERWQIAYLDLATGKVRRLTDGVSNHLGMRWSPSGRWIATSTDSRNGIDGDLLLLSPTGQSRRLAVNNGYLWLLGWAEDSSRVYFASVLAPEKIKEADLEGNVTDCPHPPTNLQRPYGIVPWNSFRRLRWWSGPVMEATLSADIPADISEFALSPDSKDLIGVANIEGVSAVYLWNTETFARRVLPLPLGVISTIRFHPRERVFAFNHSSPNSLRDVYSFDLETEMVTRWSHGWEAQPSSMTTQLVKLNRQPGDNHRPDAVTAAGPALPFYIFRPPMRGRRAPVLLYLHGGPMAQWQPGFSRLFTYLAKELGVAVVAPNVRGSTGYGEEYHKADNGENRAAALEDLDLVLDWISRQSDLNAGRMAVAGDSFGGYLTLMIVARHPDLFKAGICYAGPVDLVKSAVFKPPYLRRYYRQEYGDERDPEVRARLEQLSPVNHMTDFRIPLLLIHGVHDPRVEFAPTRDFALRLRELGSEVWFGEMPEEGHGARDQRTRHSVTLLMIGFLCQKLGLTPE